MIKLRDRRDPSFYLAAQKWASPRSDWPGCTRHQRTLLPQSYWLWEVTDLGVRDISECSYHRATDYEKWLTWVYETSANALTTELLTMRSDWPGCTRHQRTLLPQSYWLWEVTDLGVRDISERSYHRATDLREVTDLGVRDISERSYHGATDLREVTDLGVRDISECSYHGATKRSDWPGCTRHQRTLLPQSYWLWEVTDLGVRDISERSYHRATDYEKWLTWVYETSANAAWWYSPFFWLMMLCRTRARALFHLTSFDSLSSSWEVRSPAQL